MTDCVSYNRLEKAGRLGNQLFQIAATVGAAELLEARPVLPPNWSYRPYFNCPDEWFEPADGDTLNIENWAGLGHIALPARMYLQDYGLFRGVAGEVRYAFSPSLDAAGIMYGSSGYAAQAEPWLTDIDHGAIAIHVRRGDLLTQPQGFQPVLSGAYYHNALRTFDDWENRPVWCFSDDPVWCAEALPEFLGRPVKVMNTTPPRPVGGNYHRAPPMDWVDLQFLCLADHHIMSNSTYAWWAVFLANNPEPRYPSVWFGPNLSHVDISLMVPAEPTWIEVPC